MDDFRQTNAVIKHFFKLRDEAYPRRDIEKITLDLEKLLDLLENSDSFNYFADFYISKFWKDIKRDIQNTLKCIDGYQIIEESGIIIAKKKDGEWIEIDMLLPKEFIMMYLNIPEEYEDFAEIYFHQAEENIMAQILHLGHTYGLNI